MNEVASFRLAYDESVRALRAQADAHNGLRQRAGTVLATSLVVTSFFGGQAVARGAAPSALGWLAVLAFVLTACLSVWVLFPTDLPFAIGVAAVVALVESASAERDPHRELSLRLSTQHDENAGRISRMQDVFRAAAVGLVVEAVLWIAYLAAS